MTKGIILKVLEIQTIRYNEKHLVSKFKILDEIVNLVKKKVEQ